eukprot:TRINITY_DN1375_c0_g1_i2.p1 TRINITY_DN1375_c0_g1~~TRINITY_DN1375_c0_g1_i2.p1  ORF type:complete len:307 (+),score=50.80 TRINITY_DN1375_c0_g1_i2:364-1284(+)
MWGGEFQPVKGIVGNGEKTWFELHNLRVVDVVCTPEGTVFAQTESGDFYAWGDSNHGQVDPSFHGITCTPQLVTFFQASPLRRIVPGNYHATALLESGKVFAWGTNWYGSSVLQEMSTLHGGNFRVKCIVSGGVDVAVTENPTNKEQRVFMWGLGGSPQQLPFFKEIGKRVAFGSCGLLHVVFVLETGEVFTWGYMHKQHAGPQPEQDWSVSPPIEIPFFREEGLRVKQVSCGSHHTLVLLECGMVYGWGRNCHGELGISSNSGDEMAAPVEITFFRKFGKPVIQVGCGYHLSTAVVCQSAPRPPS